jgi:hypothetical protein
MQDLGMSLVEAEIYPWLYWWEYVADLLNYIKIGVFTMMVFFLM